ncbi:MAG: TonB-dependent receptor, partial [Pseudomonadota bacterium]
GERLMARFTAGDDILALAAAAPGLYAESSNGSLAPRFYMRGLGNADFTQAASQPVLIMMDEVVLEKAALKSFPMFDLDRVEVLRGPQGTLFGRNTTAGIVKMDSRKPTEETEGYVRSAIGQLGTFNIEGAFGGALNEDGTLTGRISGLWQEREDWVSNGFTGENDALGGFEDNALRAQLMWRPSEDLSILLSHQRQDRDGTSSLFRANVLSKGSNDLNSNFDRDRVFYDGGDNNPAVIKSNGTTLKIDWSQGDYTFTSITSYQDVTDRDGRGDIDGGFGCLFTCPDIPAGPTSIPENPAASPFVVNVDTGSELDLDQFTQEFRIASEYDGAFNFQAGVFYFRDDFKGTALSQSAGATVYGIDSEAEIENTTWAVFGQGTYDFTEQLRLTAGIRYTDDEKDADITDFRSGTAEPQPTISLSDDEISWDISLSYYATETTHVYARAAYGFRAPTIQDRLADDPEITTADSETITSFEIGFKSEWERVRFNSAAYYYVVDDMQLTAVGGADNSTRLLNAEEGIGYGLELELEYAITDALILTAGYGYTHTEINDSDLAVGLPDHGLITPTDPLTPEGLALIDGNPFQHAPDWTANVELSYTHDLGSNGEIYFFTDWRFRGETNDFLYESVEYTFDTQFEGGARIGYRSTANNYELGLFARNITDEENVIGGIDFANLVGYVNQPRVVGAEARYNF